MRLAPWKVFALAALVLFAARSLPMPATWFAWVLVAVVLLLLLSVLQRGTR